MSEPLSGEDRYLDEREAGLMLSLSPSYLRKLRVAGGGPIFLSFGRAIRYRTTDLHRWADGKASSSTTARDQGARQ